MLVRVAAAALVSAFALLAPHPRAALAGLSGPPQADPTAPLVAAVGLVGWLLVLWLAAVVLALLAARLPGALGALGAHVASSIAPAAVRRGLALALGLGLAAGSPAAWAAGNPSGGPALDWPLTVSAPSHAVPGPTPAGPTLLDWPGAVAAPVATAPAAPEPPDRHGAATASPTGPVVSSSRAVDVVQPGDSLWAIAARHLPPTATPAQVAASWPAWWTANRHRLGPDPHLIHPGTRLVPPPSYEKE